MSTVYTIKEKCRKCYSCIRICPAKAIKLEKGEIKTIESRCILCGSCFKVCPQNAKGFKTGFEKVKQMLDSGEKLIACLDPSFPAVLDVGTPRQLVTAVKKLGFSEVWEVAFGAELVAREYNKLLKQGKMKTIISSVCPAIVQYVEKFVPELVKFLAPIVSPVIAVGKLIKERHNPEAKVVYIGPCLARIGEIREKEVRGYIDEVLIFHDLAEMFEEKSIDRTRQEESEFDGYKPCLARLSSVSGGLLRSIGQKIDPLEESIVVTSGRYRSVRAIHGLEKGHIVAKFLDLLFCQGCIDGPFIDREISITGRRQIIANYIKTEYKRVGGVNQDDIKKFEDLDLKRGFKIQNLLLRMPTEKEIQDVLAKIDKTEPYKNLDCGACGYETCREKAIAVLQGLAEIDMCLPYLLDHHKELYKQLEKSHKELQESHRKLEEAQQQLIQTEKLASLGQLAAGVAHEINNPLGVIMIYSHILLKEIDEDKKKKEKLEIIIKESTRAKEIVKGLLSFARERKLKPGLGNINEVVNEALKLIEGQSFFHNIEITKDYDLSIPQMFMDSAQLKQVFLNIILNAAEAMKGNGKLNIKTSLVRDDNRIKIRFSDTGPGISQLKIQKIFDPFYTTKEKGTGLGLAVAYGIVQRHKGTIIAESEEGKGATFIIDLPIIKDESVLTSAIIEEVEKPGVKK
ncbi:histidine kinase [candidate division KSB1 bacterium]|nr:MAG: histidine kinase [candidate division KSB1 bacterium]